METQKSVVQIVIQLYLVLLGNFLVQALEKVEMLVIYMLY